MLRALNFSFEHFKSPIVYLCVCVLAAFVLTAIVLGTLLFLVADQLYTADRNVYLDAHVHVHLYKIRRCDTANVCLHLRRG